MGNIALDRTKIHELNPYRPPSASTAYKLVRWKPLYDFIVSGHIMGKSNKELAAEYDYTPVQISNILRADQAQIMIANATKKIREANIEEAESEVEIQAAIRKGILKRKLDFIQNDDLAKVSPFHFIDRITKLEGSAGGGGGKTEVVINNNNSNMQQNKNDVSIRTEELKRLNTALEITNG